MISLKGDDCIPVTKLMPLKKDMLKTATIEAPIDLVDYFTNSCQDVIEYIQDSFAKFDSESRLITVYAFDSKTISRVKILTDYIIAHCKQKSLVLWRKEQALKQLEESDAMPKHIAQFSIEKSLMGLVIGPKGANIAAARAINGIESIIITEINPNYSRIKITADKIYAAEEARGMLEFKEVDMDVPTDMVGKIVGKQGAFIQQIIDKTNVVRVQITENDELNKTATKFTFKGAVESIEMAMFLVELEIKFCREMEMIRHKIQEMNLTLAPKHPPLKAIG